MDPAIDPKLLEDPIFRRVLADSLSILDRFSAEPVFARTGKGFLKSEGVEGLPPDQSYAVRSLAGHIVAGVSTGEEERAFLEFCNSLET